MKIDPRMTQLCNRPLFMDRRYARQLFSSVASGMNIVSLNDAEGDVELGEKMRAKCLGLGSESDDRYRPYRLVERIAIVTVSGSLLHNVGYMGMYYAGYDAIIRIVALAVEDPEVDGILIEWDSAGGEVAGCFDTARYLRVLGEQKPIASLCNDMNLSAAMCLASAAEHRFITQTGEAGSVGVVMAHFSYEEWDKNDGVEVTLIYSGARKVDGNPYESLPDEVFQQFQTEVHGLRGEFADIVSDHLGMSVDDVLATEAAVFRGQAAIDVGFADELVNGHEAIEAFRNYLSSQGRTNESGATMNDKVKGAAPGADVSNAPTAGAESEQAVNTQASADAGQAATAERERVQGILGHEHAKGREQLANHFAFKTDMSVEDAGAALAAQPIAEPADDTPPPGTELDAAMAGHSGPTVGADAGGDGAETEAEIGKRIASNFQRYTGRGKAAGAA